jgi:hypothetical protein
MAFFPLAPDFEIKVSVRSPATTERKRGAKRE